MDTLQNIYELLEVYAIALTRLTIDNERQIGVDAEKAQMQRNADAACAALKTAIADAVEKSNEYAPFDASRVTCGDTVYAGTARVKGRFVGLLANGDVAIEQSNGQIVSTSKQYVWLRVEMEMLHLVLPNRPSTVLPNGHVYRDRTEIAPCHSRDRIVTVRIPKV